MHVRLPLAAAVILLTASAGCTGPSGTGPTISDAWARPSRGTELSTAAYLTITNSGPDADALVGASSAAAASVELHETAMDASGMMGMRPVARIEVPAGGTVRLEPGGLHLMLMGLSQPLAAGDALTLDLVFERAGAVSVQASVREG